MPAFTLSSWNLSTVTLASNKSHRNKLRRRRRPPPPLFDMAAVANGNHDGAEAVPSMPTPTTAPSTAGSSSPTLHEKHISDPRERDTDKDDAQVQVITSLRAQITDLITQVSQLNGKLVKSYDRVSDLEDELHVAASSARGASLKISSLEIERSQHLAALNTGLYVEKAHVTAELTRLMERATAEAAARGQAESARQNIEQELDDLSASLFDQANTMVAEARLGRAMSERKVIEAEMALKSAEEAVGIMQDQMQTLREEKDRTSDEIARLRTLMEKGKFVERAPVLMATSVKLLSLHAPYQEFLQFIVHLRSLRHSAVNPPHISTLLPLPFLARVQTEDSDPTVRLDFAPSLNWLSRRSVLSAIHGGQLTVEPMSVTTFLTESTTGLQSMIAGSHASISCALCGTNVFPPKPSDGGLVHPPSHPLSSLSLSRHGSSNIWTSSLFKNPLSNAAPSPPLTPSPRDTSTPSTPTHGSSMRVYVFRLSQTQAPQHPPSSYPQSQHNQTQRPTSYPLCNSGWCLARLRTTCSLWAFIRAGVVDRVWEEEPVLHTAPSLSSASVYSVNSTTNNDSTSKIAKPAPLQKEVAPPLPPRRRSKVSSSVGALWGMASGALRGSTPSPSQPASPSQDGKEKEVSTESPTKGGSTPTKKAAPEPLKVTVPPPLPRRNLSRRAAGNEETNDAKIAEGATGNEEEKRIAASNDSILGSSSPIEAAKSETTASEKTPVARSKSRSPGPRPMLEAGQLTHANSQDSSAHSAAGEEFTTPVEEIGSLPLSFSVAASTAETPSVTAIEIPPRPTTPHSPPHSPRSNARSSMSPPRSPAPHPKRISSPPPPHSPRAIPLPDSRPGTPATPVRSHVRHLSGSVAVAQLNVSTDGSRPPSRAASPALVGSPPPVPRRAAARRAVPPPPSSAPPPSSGSSDEKDSSPQSSPAEDQKQNGRSNTKAETPKAEEPSRQRMSVDVSRAPPVPPRRADHMTHGSVSDFGDQHDDGRMEATQDRPRREQPQENIKNGKREGEVSETDASKNVIGDLTWEGRTWKEIVRLREDMFWARIGGIRG